MTRRWQFPAPPAARRSTRPRAGRGFTLAELLVAITITTLMLLLINQLFNSTSRAVTVGLKTADIVMESEVVGQQVADDFERMLEHGDDDDVSFLVVIQHAIPEVAVMRRGRFADTDEYHEPFIRSDQVIFIKGDPSGGDPPIRSLTPQHDGQFGSSIQGATSRIRYGHARRVEPGTDTGDPLGQGVNRWANNWVLARHETLLEPHDPVDGQDFDPNRDWHAETVGWMSPVHHVMHSDAPSPLYLGHSITDVADQELENLLNELEVADPYYDPLLEPDYDPGGGGGVQGPYGWTPPPTLPLANPDPDRDQGQHAFNAWRIGQMHPVLSGHVSDFIVEFAGDYDDPATLNEHPDNEGQINRDEDGNIIWYAFEPTDPDDAQAFVNYGGAEHRYRPRIHPFPEDPAPAAIPIGAEEMYYLGPSELDEYGSNVDRTAAYIWRHDDDSDDAWPWLLRIRYRLHDPQGHVQSPRLDAVGERDEPWLGQWFEHIIALPRASNGS